MAKKTKAASKRGRRLFHSDAEDEVSNEPMGSFAGEQAELPGAEVESNPALERMGRSCAKDKDARKAATDKFNTSKATLILKMQELDIRDYDKHGVHIHLKENLDVDVTVE